MLFTALKQNNPVAIRYPRGSGLGVPIDSDFQTVPIGQSEVLLEGEDLLLLAIGSTVAPALEAAEQLKREGHSVTVVNCRFVKPLDKKLADYAKKIRNILIVEDNILQGGFGSALLELFNDMNAKNIRVRRLGLPDKFVEHGPLNILRAKYGLDRAGILKEARNLISGSKEEKREA